MRLEEIETELEAAFDLGVDCLLDTIHREYSERLLGYIKSHGGLSLEDVDDVYQKTLIGLWRAAIKPGFDKQKPLRLAFHIAKRRIADSRRRRRLPMLVIGNGWKDFFIDDMRGSELGKTGRLDRVEWAEFDAELCKQIAILPTRQRVAATCYAELYEEIRSKGSHAALAEAMGNALGEHVTVVAAKNAWHEAKKKLAQQLTRCGYNFLSDV